MSPSPADQVAQPAVPPDAFYLPDPAAGSPIAEGRPGTLLRSLQLAAPDGLRGWAILHASAGVHDEPIAVSGLVIAPAGPLDGRPVLAWAHGTTGIADVCAPSRDGVLGFGVPPLLDLARQGWIVVATDYEGLGTPGVHPYLVGLSEGRGILDSLRATQSLLPETAAARLAVLGISQGGHAALWAAELAPTYAPELDLAGVVAASPPIDLAAVQRLTIGAARSASSAETVWIEPLMGAAAWSETYGLPIDEVLTPTGRALARELLVQPPQDLMSPAEAPFSGDPTRLPAWQALLEANSPGHRASSAPILVVAASDDEIIPAQTIEPGVERLRRAGSNVELRWVTGGHVAPLTDPAAASASLIWLLQRLTSGR